MEPIERRDDWRRGVDANLASLNAGQRIWEREFKAIKAVLFDIDHLLRGDPEKDTDGIIARLHNQENDVNLLKGIILKDRAGNKGLVGRIEALEGGESSSERHWKFATAVVVAFLSLLGLILTNWGALKGYLEKATKPDALEEAIQNAKHPKGHRHHVVIQEPIEDSE